MRNKLFTFAGCAILVSIVLFSIVKFRYTINDKISVTGLGEKEFVSDLIVWQGTILAESSSLSEGYEKLEKSQKKVKEYVLAQGIDENSIIFNFVDSYRNQEPIYQNGNYIGTKDGNYSLRQNIKIESTEVDKVEKLSRNITDLLLQGIKIESQMPQYFYTKLDELKLEIISLATKDAKERADIIAEKADSKVGDLASAKMGVFQIVGANSSEAYSWGGTYNTTSKNKKANITIRLDYHIK